MRRPRFLPTRDYLCNSVVSRIPWASVRMAGYRALGVRCGAGSLLMLRVGLLKADGITIGESSVVNPYTYLDGRGGLRIGSNVNISTHVVIVAGTHDLDDAERFYGSLKPTVIEDYAWLCTRCTILPGVTIGKGSVIGAGAVVTRSTEPFTINAGVPARVIGRRREDLRYQLTYQEDWV